MTNRGWLLCLIALGCSRTVADYRNQAKGATLGGTPGLTGTLADGATASSDRSAHATINVTLSGLTPDVVTYRLGNDANFTGSHFAAITTSPIAWTLTAGDGLKTVYLQVSDIDNALSPISQATITLDTQAPLWVAPLTVSSPVISPPHTLSVSYGAVDNIDAETDLQIGIAQTDPPDCSAVIYGSFGTGETTYTLAPAQDGQTYTVSACIRDRAGNVAQAPNFAWPSVRVDDAALLPPQPSVPATESNGALLTWKDTNTDTDYVEVDASPVADFSSDVQTQRTTPGHCNTKAATTLEFAPLANNQLYYFRMRAVDCAGLVSSNSKVVSLVVGIVERSFENLPVGANFFADGDNLYLYYVYYLTGHPSDSAVLLHCRESEVDCRDSSRWTTALITLDTAIPTGGSDFVDLAGVAMEADDDNLYLFSVINVGGAPEARVALTACPKALPCDFSQSWTTQLLYDNTSANPPDMHNPKAAIAAGALTLIAGQQTASTGLSLSRCPLVSGICGTGTSSWKTSILNFPADPNATTLLGDASTFYLGFVENGTGNYRPGFATCRNGCAAISASCSGNASAGSGTCGDFTYFVLDATANAQIAPPVVTTARGQLFAAWTKGVGANTEVDLRHCSLANGCSTAPAFDPAVSLGSFASVTSISGFTAAPRADDGTTLLTLEIAQVRVGYTRLRCALSETQPCTTAAAWQPLVIADVNADSASTQQVGTNLFSAALLADASTTLFMPAAPTPWSFASLPDGANADVSWQSFEDGASTQVIYGDQSTLLDHTQTLADPFVGSLSLPATNAHYVESRFVTSRGLSDPTFLWTTEAFTFASATYADLDAPSSAAIARDPDSGDLFSARVSGGEMVVGRCAAGTADCGATASWQRNIANTSPTWNSADIAIDVPRDWYTHAPIPGMHGRIYAAGSWDSNSTYVEGCDLQDANHCMTNPWSGTLNEGHAATAGELVSISAMSDQVLVTGKNSRLTVGLCDGGPTNRRPCEHTASAEPATAQCLSAANWKWVTIATSANPAGGIAHPTYGWMAFDVNGNLWTCPYSVIQNVGSCSSGGFALTPNDCSVATWTKNSFTPEMTTVSTVVADPGAAPLAADPEATAVFVSFMGETGWEVASCHAPPDPLFQQTWACAVDPGAWRSVLLSTVTDHHPIASTTQIIDGKLVVTLLESTHLRIAVCDNAICNRASDFHVTALATQLTLLGTEHPGHFLTRDPAGGFFLGIPGATAGTMDVWEHGYFGRALTVAGGLP